MKTYFKELVDIFWQEKDDITKLTCDEDNVTWLGHFLYPIAHCILRNLSLNLKFEKRSIT